MESMKRLCQRSGATVVCTVHQPRSNIFGLFDQLLLIHNGSTIYFGRAHESVNYFSRVGMVCPRYMNPADFFLDTLSEGGDAEDKSSGHSHEDALESAQISAQRLAKLFAQSNEQSQLEKQVDTGSSLYQATNEKPSTSSATGAPHTSRALQVFILVHRTWLDSIRDSGVMYVRTGAAVFVSLLLGVIFFQQDDSQSSSNQVVNSMIFLMCCFGLFCLPSISKFIEERLLYVRERACGYYTTVPYLLAHFVVESPILLATTIIYCSITYWMVGYYASVSHYVFFMVLVFCVIQVGFAMSQVISATVANTGSVRSVNTAIACYVVFLLYSLLLGGFIIRKNQLPSWGEYLLYTSYFYYGWSSLMVNEYEDRSYGENVLESDHLEHWNKWVGMGALLAMWAILEVALYCSLRWLNREKR